MQNITSTIINEFPEKRIVIVGDLVADQFLSGTIDRVSREAPVFIMKHETTDTRAGAAANAAVNVASLGAKPLLIGVVGRDVNGDLLKQKLADNGVDCGHIVSSDKLTTTTKIRVLAGQYYAPRKQVIRIDYENKAAFDNGLRARLRENLLNAAKIADAIVISDYNYGVADSEITELARKISGERKIPLLIDSRFRLSEFPDATTATPNQEEVEQILGKNFSAADCVHLCEELNYEALLVTRGNKGMLLAEKGKAPIEIDAVGSTEPVDVTGAGDTVIAAYALGLASGLDFAPAANLANHAGSIVVMKKGTASISSDEILASFGGESKIKASHSS